MAPTYSASEVNSLLPLLDLPQVILLAEVCNEEANEYSPSELEAVNWMIMEAKKNLSLNELQLEYLLSFN